MLLREGFEGRKELLLLHMEGCPHCVKLMPEWKIIFASMNNGSIIKLESMSKKGRWF